MFKGGIELTIDWLGNVDVYENLIFAIIEPHRIKPFHRELSWTAQRK